MALTYTLTKKQLEELEALAYWVANENKTRERNPEDRHEIQKCHDTICKCIFPALDALQVPFWVQNTVIVWAENWRNTLSNYLYSFLTTKNIFVA